MPVTIRNPFRRNASAPLNHTLESEQQQSPARPGPDSPASETGLFSTDEVGRALGSKAKSASAINIAESKSPDEKNTYKLSVVNDSGIYLPPSPPDNKSFWGRSDHSPQARASSMDEPFVISRESFESYRRSFDISARSPVLDPPSGRVSLDSRPPVPRTSLDIRSPRLPIVAKSVESVEEDKFEDIKLNDEVRPKKRSIFYRFGTTDHSSSDGTPAATSGGGTRSGFFGRKDAAHEVVIGSELRRIGDAKKDDK